MNRKISPISSLQKTAAMTINDKPGVSAWHRRRFDRDFDVFFQLQHDMASTQVVGMEALLRMRGSANANVAPINVIAHAELDGSIREVGLWVLEKSLNFFAGVASLLPTECRVSVNITPQQLITGDFCSDVEALLARSNSRGQNLELELTENSPILNMAKAIAQIERLADIGVSVVLDDFGTGYTSLPYLAALPIDGVKLDRSFTHRLDCAKNRSIVRSLLGLAGELDLRVVVEGIETQMQKNFYLELGSVVGQGFYFHQPTCAEDTRRALTALGPFSQSDLQ